MNKSLTGSILGEIPKSSFRKSATEILEEGNYVVVCFGFFTGKKKLLLGVQSTENSWLNCAPVLSFNGFVKIEDDVFPCIGIKTEKKSIITILK